MIMTPRIKSLLLCFLFFIISLSLYISSNLYSREAYVENLSLIGGHLKVGQELLDLGEPVLAAPHFGHPIKEHWQDVEKEIGKQNINIPVSFTVPDSLENGENACSAIGNSDRNRKIGFRKALDCLDIQSQETPYDEAFKVLFSAIDTKIQNLLKAVPAEKAWVGIQGVINRAEEEYIASSETKKIEAGEGEIDEAVVRIAIEYQDARGFIEYVKEYSESMNNDSITSITSELLMNMPLKYSIDKSAFRQEYTNVISGLSSLKEELGA